MNVNSQMLSKKNIHLYAAAAVLLLLAVLCMAAPAAAAGGTTGNLTWDLTGGTLTISGEGEMPDYSDSSDAPWYSYRSSITSVVIEDGVTSIGDEAFAVCSSLTSVEIPSSVTSIGDSAFVECCGLASVTFAEGSLLMSVGEWAFYSCSGLTSIVIPSNVTSVGEYAFSFCIRLTSVTFAEGSLLTSLGSNAFAWSGLTSIEIPSSVTSLGGSAFFECSDLTSVVIPSSVTIIGSSAFSYCSGLTSVVIPSSVTIIGSSAFSYCSGLTSINVDGGNTKYKSLDGVLFSKDGTLLHTYPAGKSAVSYEIPSSVTSIGDSAFEGCSNLTSVVIPSNVTSIGSGAFWGCRGLTSVEIPSSVTSIGDSAFVECCGLASVTFAEGSLLTSVGECAFSACSNLTSAVIPSNVTSIGSGAFWGCRGLTSVVIPSSVTSIGSGAFQLCSGLTSVVISSGVTSIGDHAFSYCSGLISVVIPSSVTSIGHAAFSYCSNLTSINVDGGNTEYKSLDGVLFSKDGTLLHTYPAGKSAVSYDIPSSVTSIGDLAFCWCSGLTSVVIPSSVTSIGSYAFEYCSGLTSVVIPSSVTSIGCAAFYNLAANSIIYGTNARLLSDKYHTDRTALAVKNVDGSCTFTSYVTSLTLSAANAPSGITYGGWFAESTFTTPVTSIAKYTNPTLWLKNLAHTVTVTSTVGGSASASAASAAEGTLITLSASADSGYVFDRWQVVSGGVTIAGNKFTMPACDVEIKAVFKAAEEPTDGLHLLPGWNFVSVPKKLAAAYDTAAELFGSVSTGGKSILTYNAVTKSWEQVTASTVIEPLNAYWVYSVGSMALTPAFDSEAHAPAMKTLYEGWNAVGLSAEESMPASIAFAGIDWRTYLSWDAAKQKYDSPIIKGVSGTYGDSNPVLLWEGGWLYMDAAGTYIGFA